MKAKILSLVHTLILTEDNFSTFLEQLTNVCQADASYLFRLDTNENMQTTFKYERTNEKENIQTWFRDATSDSISKVATQQLNNGSSIIGYIMVDNPKLNETSLILDELSDFIVATLLNEDKLEQLYYESCIDRLTLLRNRNEYIKTFKLLKTKVPDTLGIIFIDLNSLKQINDTQGHKVGDEIIKEVAHYIRYYAKDKAFRFGGDEFIVIADDFNKKEFGRLLDSIKDCFAKIKKYTVSIGYSYRNKKVDIEEQVKEADEFMYKQKQLYYKSLTNDRRKSRDNGERFWKF